MIKGWEHLSFWDKHFDTVNANVIVKEHLIGDPNKIFPSQENWFKALELTPAKEVRCVILGQDPYPTRGHAEGLAFSVQPHVRPFPPSLHNIFSEYQSDLQLHAPKTGSLESWARNNVLLLNRILTVEEGKPLSHANLGWEQLADEICSYLSEHTECCFILWGRIAQEAAGRIPKNRRIASPHPSPRSATTGFFGSRPFSKANTYLKESGQQPIYWKLP